MNINMSFTLKNSAKVRIFIDSVGLFLIQIGIAQPQNTKNVTFSAKLLLKFNAILEVNELVMIFFIQKHIYQVP